jgi:aminoglycoside phosphotransferase (APT) family kinase protein
MCARKMHADEIETDAALVRRLLEAQFPQWADLPIEPVPSAGTDNALYRLSENMVVRLPRIHWATGQVDKECTWLPRLAPHLPLSIPVPLARGNPGEGYPYHWSVCLWLPGENAAIERLSDPFQAAVDLAQFILALQQIDSTNGLLPDEHDLARGKPLVLRDPYTRQAITSLEGMLDTRAVTAAWEAALLASPWDKAPVWIHGDLMSGNLLAKNGRLSAVIDFGCLAVGDPAYDVMAAWLSLPAEARSVFREVLRVDDDTWNRARGLALSIGLFALPYYKETNPALTAASRRTIDAVLADRRENGYTL